MPRICDYAVIKPLSIIYKTCIKNVIYSDTRKKCNIVPVQKKGDKQMVNNNSIVHDVYASFDCN